MSVVIILLFSVKSLSAVSVLKINHYIIKDFAFSEVELCVGVSPVVKFTHTQSERVFLIIAHSSGEFSCFCE